ncbi:protein of unknown function [Enterobacter cancerogenus]|nr:protein of unknown function [Enterobacter cancerogenus]
MPEMCVTVILSRYQRHRMGTMEAVEMPWWLKAEICCVNQITELIYGAFSSLLFHIYTMKMVSGKEFRQC